MKKGRKLNKLKVTIAIIIVVLFFATFVFGRYIYNSAREAYFISKQFYFSSDILTVSGTLYQFDNWTGTDVYPIEFELRSYNNEISKLNYDLEYIVSCETDEPDKVQCTVNSYGEGASSTGTGTIYASNNVSNVAIYVKPLVPIEENDSITIRVTARTEVPYQKELKCDFILKPRAPAGVSYKIEDVANRDYAVLQIFNTADSGSNVVVDFNPTTLRVDSNDEIYVNRIVDKTRTTNIGGSQYVNKFVFFMEKESTKYVKFYKVDKTQNYTYTGVSGTSAITVDVE